MNKIVLFLILQTAILLTGRVARAQRPQLKDSSQLAAARREINSPGTPNPVRLELLSQVVKYYIDQNVVLATRYAEQGADLAHRVNNPASEAYFLRVLSSMANQTSNDRAAIAANKRLIALGPRLPVPAQWTIREAYKGLAGVELNRAAYPAARHYYRQAAEWNRRHPAPGDSVAGAGRAWDAINMLDYYAAQLEFGNTADSILRGVERYARRGLAFDRTHPHQRRYTLAHEYKSLATVARTTGRLDTAVAYYQRAIRVYHDQDEDPISEAEARHMLAGVLIRQRQFLPAGKEAQQAAKLFEDGGVADADVYATWSVALAALGRYQEAQTLALRAKAIVDSLNVTNGAEAVAQLRVQFDTELKEARIRSLTQQRRLQQEQAQRQQQRLWGVGILLGLVLMGLGIVTVLALRLRRSRAQLSRQNELLANQRDELAQARATQDALYALIAHDLRTPVIAFTGLVDLFGYYHRRAEVEEVEALTAEVRQAAQSLSELLDNLLNWAMSQRGELSPKPQPLRVAELLTQIVELYQNAATAANVELTTDAPPSLLLTADPDMTRTILRNLTGNALKATPSGGHVVLRALLTESRVEFRVVDTGKGLSADQLAQLNAPNSSLRVAGRHSGAGLGLRLSRFFTEVQGGKLELMAAPNGGTEARFQLPLNP